MSCAEPRPAYHQVVTDRRHARRRALLRAVLVQSGVAALLVTDLVNIRYLTGFTGSNAALLVVGTDGEDGQDVAGSAGGSGSDDSSVARRRGDTAGDLDPRTRFCTDGRGGDR